MEKKLKIPGSTAYMWLMRPKSNFFPSSSRNKIHSSPESNPAGAIRIASSTSGIDVLIKGAMAGWHS
jgi:hypothetical protein